MYLDREPPSLLSMYHTHYASALTGNANQVGDYVRKSLINMEWIKNIHPRLDTGDMEDIQVQANFILTVIRNKYGYRAYPDFGRFYSMRILPIIERIKYDESFAKAFSDILTLDVKDLRNELITIIEKMKSAGLGSSYWWNSIDEDDLLTRKEIEAREVARKAKSDNS